MSESIVIALVEMVIGLLVEGIILSFVFNAISNTANEKQQRSLKAEMNNIEVQNKFIYEQLQIEIREAKHEIISQIKESAAANKKGGNN